ncbi:MAG: hypothetical protein R3E83_19310 [Burkholderiaceae bacterium]
MVAISRGYDHGGGVHRVRFEIGTDTIEVGFVAATGVIAWAERITRFEQARCINAGVTDPRVAALVCIETHAFDNRRIETHRRFWISENRIFESGGQQPVRVEHVPYAQGQEIAPGEASGNGGSRTVTVANQGSMTTVERVTFGGGFEARVLWVIDQGTGVVVGYQTRNSGGAAIVCS